VLGLVGPNGAGKTTLLNLITGFVVPDQGELSLGGRPLARLAPHKVARLGLTRTFQTPFLYEEATVVENVRRAIYAVAREPVARQVTTRRSGGRSYERATGRALDLLDEVGLGRACAQTQASSLPYGNRKLLSIAMVMATDPKIVCLDEPAAGLSSPEKENVLSIVRALQQRGVAVVLVEHDMNVITAACDHVMVLNYGRCIAEGPAADVLQNPQVVAAYLGGAYGAAAA
jgi:ABC-type branched-subunit amino acid transport system ATPase component